MEIIKETGKLSTIQKRGNLHQVYRTDEPGADNAYHKYVVRQDKFCPHEEVVVAEIQFQHGPRNEEGSTRGVLDNDLMEIVRDRLKAFQSGPYACRENALALTHIEEALMWMNRRVEDHIERGVLGTMEK